MKKKYFALVLGCILALALAGCSSKKNENAQNVEPSGTVQSNQPENSTGMTSSDDPDRSSAGIEGDDHIDNGMDDGDHSPDVNDATEGGGAGGTNDVDNDGQPDPETGARSRSNNSIGDDIGHAADDIIDGIGDAGRDVGNAARDMIDDIGNASR